MTTNRSSFFLSAEFAALQESLPYRGKTYRIEEGDVHALVVRMKMRFGLTWLWVLAEGTKDKGWGDIETPFVKKLWEIIRKEKAVYARLEPLNSVDSEISFGGRPAKKRYTPEHTLVLDITKSEEKILAAMKPKGRYNIKVAQKHGVEVKRYDSFEKIPAEDFDAFYEILSATGERDGFGINPKYYYEQLLKIFGATKKASLFLAYTKDKTVVGGSIVVYEGETATYYYGASSNSHRNVMAPYLVQWEAIMHAKKIGYKQYDFLGIAPANGKNHPWAGVTDFKKKFGGAEVSSYPASDVVARPFWYWLSQR